MAAAIGTWNSLDDRFSVIQAALLKLIMIVIANESLLETKVGFSHGNRRRVRTWGYTIYSMIWWVDTTNVIQSDL